MASGRTVRLTIESLVGESQGWVGMVHASSQRSIYLEALEPDGWVGRARVRGPGRAHLGAWMGSSTGHYAGNAQLIGRGYVRTGRVKV